MRYELCMGGGGGFGGRRLSRDGRVAHYGEKGLRCHYSSHTVPYENGMYGRIDCRRRSGSGDFEIDDLVLKPVGSVKSAYLLRGNTAIDACWRHKNTAGESVPFSKPPYTSR